MREVKLRAWVTTYSGGNIMADVLWINFREHVILADNGLQYTDYKLLQFTGLYDESGREIYEGDILAHIDAYDSLFGKVVWDDKAACWAFAILMEDGSFDLDRLDDHAAYAEVIGNIYDNPELLK
jgi:uncharacterized phage protein (TIGR01671 family)